MKKVCEYCKGTMLLKRPNDDKPSFCVCAPKAPLGGWPKSPRLKIFLVFKKQQYRDRYNRYWYGPPEMTFRAEDTLDAERILAEHTKGKEGKWRLHWKAPYCMSFDGGLLRVDEKIFPICHAVQKLIDTGKPPKIIAGLGKEVDDAIHTLMCAVGLYNIEKKRPREGGIWGMAQRHAINGLGMDICPKRWDVIFEVMKAKGLLQTRWLSNEQRMYLVKALSGGSQSCRKK